MLLVILVRIYYLSDKDKKMLNSEARDKLGGSYISLSDGITNYRISGPIYSQVVVLIHGGTVPMWTWDNQIFKVTC